MVTPRSELIGSSVEKLIPDKMREFYGEFMAEFMRSPRTVRIGAERPLIAMNAIGQERRVEISVSPLQGKGTQLIAYTIRDISKRIEIEAEPRQTTKG